MAKVQSVVGLDHQPEAGVPTYGELVASGARGGGLGDRIAYLARLNYAHTYIQRLRKRSNDPAWLARAGRIERRLLHPFAPAPARTARARQFLEKDLYDPGLVKIALNGSFSSWAGGPHTQCSRIGFIRSEVS